MVNWEDKDVEAFKEEARDIQQVNCDLLGDREWDVVEIDEWTILRRKVGYGLYREPESEPEDDNKHTGYSKEQLNEIEKICNQLVGCKESQSVTLKHRSIHFACIYIVMKLDQLYPTPVFKAKLEDDTEGIFVDSSARKYSKWNDYLEDNILPKCIYCYPTNGLYETDRDDGAVCVKFDTSPACKVAKRVLNFADTAATCVAFATVAVGVAAMCTVPVAGPIIAASSAAVTSTSVYGLGRSGYALFDRAKHRQSIGLADAEARGCWLSIVGSSLGFAQGRMIASMTKAARAGEVLGRTSQIAFLAVQTGSLTVNGLGVAQGLAILIEKKKRNELRTLDVFQFTSSLLFFANTAVNMKTASTIIKDVQCDVIESHRQGLSEPAEKLFNKQIGRLRGKHEEIKGNARVVKQLNRIGNTKDLYEMMSDSNVNSNKVRLTSQGLKGMLNVNKNLKIHPLKLLKMPPESREAIFTSTNDLNNGTITKEQFDVIMKPTSQRYRINFESTREEAQLKLCHTFGEKNVEDIAVGGKQIFKRATEHDLDRLGVQPVEILLKTKEFARRMGCSTASEFISYLEYFKAYIGETISSYEASYQADLAAAKQQPGFDQTRFDEARGIKRGVDRSETHLQKAIDPFSSPEGYNKLIDHYKAIKDEVALYNSKPKFRFISDDKAAYHYLKHKNFNGRELTVKEYYELGKVVENPTNRRTAGLSQDGDCFISIYADPKTGAKVVMVDKGGKSNIATIFYDDRVKCNEYQGTLDGNSPNQSPFSSPEATQPNIALDTKMIESENNFISSKQSFVNGVLDTIKLFGPKRAELTQCSFFEKFIDKMSPKQWLKYDKKPCKTQLSNEHCCDGLEKKVRQSPDSSCFLKDDASNDNLRMDETPKPIASYSESSTCVFCSEIGHVVEECKKFEEESVEGRREWAKVKQFCTLCLKENHYPVFCRSKIVCILCRERHHQLLHIPV